MSSKALVNIIACVYSKNAIFNKLVKSSCITSNRISVSFYVPYISLGRNIYMKILTFIVFVFRKFKSYSKNWSVYLFRQTVVIKNLNYFFN